MFDVGNVLFAAELLVAALIFLYPCPRRHLFFVRFPIVVALLILIAGFFPMPEEIKYSWYYSLFRFLMLFFLTCLGTGLCFRVGAVVILSLCAAGYAVQHIGFHCLSLAEHLPFFPASPGYGVEIACFAAVYVVLWLVFGRTAAKHAYYKNYDKTLAVTSFVIVLVCVGITRIARAEIQGSLLISVSLYSSLSCLLALILQFSVYRRVRLASENALIRTLRANDKKMYEITKDTIEAINIKCHDLKHRIYAMQKFPGEETEELKNLLRIYDSSIRTGNDVVDVVLMDYALRYDRAGVRFSFHGDGSELSFLSEVEIASLFGNAVSNAAEAAVKLKDPEKRLVDLRLERTGGLLTFTARNYIEEAPLVREGHFVSSKGEDGREHGFGLRSMEQIAKKYGGGVRVLTEEDIFILSVFMLVK